MESAPISLTAVKCGAATSILKRENGSLPSITPMSGNEAPNKSARLPRASIRTLLCSCMFVNIHTLVHPHRCATFAPPETERAAMTTRHIVSVIGEGLQCNPRSLVRSLQKAAISRANVSSDFSISFFMVVLLSEIVQFDRAPKPRSIRASRANPQRLSLGQKPQVPSLVERRHPPVDPLARLHPQLVVHLGKVIADRFFGQA